MKTAIVTGASSGLGKAVTNLLLKKDWQVFALARSIEEVDFDGDVHKLKCDIQNLNDIKKVFKTIDQESENIDLLVNCAGIGLVKAFEKTTGEEIANVLGVNLAGSIYIAQEVYKSMILQERGHIINVGSTSSLKARKKEALYCASKWGLRGFTESLRLEAKQHSVKVTGIYPGGMSSKNFWNITPDKDISGYMKSEEVAKQIIKVVYQGDGVTLSEVVIERP